MMSYALDATLPPQLTPELTFLKGAVSLSEYSIPFFTTNVTLGYAADNFKLFEDLAQADTGEWTLEELFQRDISWTRVESDILQYLKNTSRPQFFNALTIALLPSGIAEFGADHGEGLNLPLMNDPHLGRPIEVGGIQIQYYGQDKDVPTAAGKLRWSTGHVDAVAVDGQHRLAAIKRYVKQTKRSVWENAAIPVIFVITDPRVGFATPHASGEKARSVGALRALFIDLNKNARPVSPTRNILLDDLDIVSVSTRALIGRSLGAMEEEGRIPLALVDWLTDKNKVEDGPFLTTVMLLNEANARLLNVPDPQLDEEDDSIAKVEAWLNRALPPPNDQVRQDLMSQVAACALQQSKLTWLPHNIEALRTIFEREWRPHLRRLFREFKPYNDLWTYSKEHHLLGPDFVNLYVAKEVMPGSFGLDRARRLEETAKRGDPSWSLAKRYERPLAHINVQLKQSGLAFKVVFQRALLRSLVDLMKDPGQFLLTPGDRTSVVSAFLEAMNCLSEARGLALDYSGGRTKMFWAGSALTADGTIEFSNAGAERLRAWLLGFVVLHAAGAHAPRFNVLDTSSQRPFEFLYRMFSGDFQSVVIKGMEKLARAREEEDPETEALVLIRNRYEHLRKLSIA